MFNKKYIDKIKELKEKITEKEFMVETFKDANKELKRKIEHQSYRETLLEQEKLELNNVISNLMEEKNQLNIKLLDKKKKVVKNGKINK